MSESTPTAAPSKPKPSIGRVVHFVLPDDSAHAGEHRAAVIAQAFEGDKQLCNLTVHKGQSTDFVATAHGSSAMSTGCDTAATVLIGSISHDSNGAPGTWHWPEQV